MRLRFIAALGGAALIAAGSAILAHRETADRPRVDLALLPSRPSSSVDVEALHRLISSADKIVITDGPNNTVLFSSTRPEDARSFNEALDVQAPTNWNHDMCEGSPAIHLYTGGKEAVLITYHHGHAIRTSLWSSDAPLPSQAALLKWFDARGITGPRSELEYETHRAEEYRTNRSRWIAAMPSLLRPFQSQILAPDYPSPSLDRGTLLRALERAGARPEQIRILYHWFGSGAGPWSGYPSYETCAEELLLQFETSELIAVASRPDLNPTELQGAARLFAGWTFSQQRPNDWSRLPASLKATLLKHGLENANEDRQARARHAFETPQ